MMPQGHDWGFLPQPGYGTLAFGLESEVFIPGPPEVDMGVMEAPMPMQMRVLEEGTMLPHIGVDRFEPPWHHRGGGGSRGGPWPRGGVRHPHHHGDRGRGDAPYWGKTGRGRGRARGPHTSRGRFGHMKLVNHHAPTAAATSSSRPASPATQASSAPNSANSSPARAAVCKYSRSRRIGSAAKRNEPLTSRPPRVLGRGTPARRPRLLVAYHTSASPSTPSVRYSFHRGLAPRPSTKTSAAGQGAHYRQLFNPMVRLYNLLAGRRVLIPCKRTPAPRPTPPLRLKSYATGPRLRVKRKHVPSLSLTYDSLVMTASVSGTDGRGGLSILTRYRRGRDGKSLIRSHSTLTRTKASESDGVVASNGGHGGQAGIKVRSSSGRSPGTGVVKAERRVAEGGVSAAGGAIKAVVKGSGNGESGVMRRVASNKLLRARQVVQQALLHSRNRTLRRSKKPLEYCLFFNRFGRCQKGKDCPYIHDKDKVAVCRKFLRGECTEGESCVLSHVVSQDKMPTCAFFLRGACNNGHCPYSHVKVNDRAEVCQAFLKGYCPAGKSCKLKHQESHPRAAAKGALNAVKGDRPAQEQPAAVKRSQAELAAMAEARLQSEMKELFATYPSAVGAILGVRWDGMDYRLGDRGGKRDYGLLRYGSERPVDEMDDDDDSLMPKILRPRFG